MILPIGPIHPGLKEPVRLKLETQGEKVISAEIDFGYVHRGIERVMTGKTWQKGIYLSERVCGICSYIHTQTFAETFEKIAGERVPLRAQYLRSLTNELDRIQSHFIANSTYFKAIEHETLFMYMLHLREPIMDAIELL
ncbi:MAG: nickel-dependent hydrogenase large subunit, partial [Euryarchaeota archaeon]|nr:nickel-dependent hydrogenase large subunit [Euryarchaeota archaeon]